MDQLNPTSLTWAALLSGWLDFARTSVTLPDDAHGRAWRESVAAVIRLQAVTFALGEIERLDPDEQALAIDRSELLIAQSRDELTGAWRDEPLPESLEEVLRDAKLALEAARMVSQRGRVG